MFMMPQESSTKRILITGGLGFIGSHLVQALKDSNIHIVDNSREFNFTDNATYVDICDFEALSKVFRKFKPTHVVHLAAHIDARESMANPIKDAQTNIMGSLNVLHLSSALFVKKVVLASSAAVYEDDPPVASLEADVCSPLTPYGLAKMTMEGYAEHYERAFGLNSTVLRFSNVYGKGQRSNSVVSTMTRAMNQGNKFVMANEGKSLRDYIYVKDVVEAIIIAMNSKRSSIYNVSTNTETSVKALAYMVNEITKGGLIFSTENIETKEARKSRLSNLKIQRELAWSPKHTLLEGLKETLL